ncbi:MarC family protein [Roseovarius sp. M141]|uniref:MarC family protein n=1 Tax=Roseovarius sp. M141 TaxID=2583806 RepID=UPI0020CBEC15|nr:MarC family protein [Roseovarius sp. M141]MCQ0092776.1 MarC family protein [Roseovarius sp. M141]
MDSSALITTFVTLLIVLDPFALAPLFLALTRGMSAAMRRSVAIRSCLMGTALLVVFGAFGEAVLGFIGISMPAFRIAGGILLFLTALDMLFERRTKRREDQVEHDDHEDPSIFPLGIPLIAGPGAIATVILLTGENEGLTGLAWVLGTMLFVMCLVFVSFLSAGLLERALGKTGISVVTRVLGMLLAALAVQFVLDGLRGFGLAG